ncbi:MAG: hypothetical protein ACR2LY_00265 [Thermoleophilaceae bacterium]
MSSIEIALLLGGLVVLAGYGGLILAPAWTSYGRVWEKLAASFLSLFMLVTLVALGVAVGLVVFWSYARLA